MLTEAMKSFELDLKKNDHMYESALDTFKIKSLEIHGLEEQGFFGESADGDIYLESAGEFMAKVREFFDNLIKAFKKLIDTISNKIGRDIEAKEVNKKLDYLARCVAYSEAHPELIEGTAKGKSRKVMVEITEDRLKNIKEYISIATAGAKKLYGKEYDSVADYEKARAEYSKILDLTAEKLHLNDTALGDKNKTEREMFIKDAITYSKKEIANREKLIKQYQEEYDTFIKQMKKLAENEDDISKIADIKFEANKVTRICSKVVNAVAKHPVMIALAVIYSGMWIVGAVADHMENN